MDDDWTTKITGAPATWRTEPVAADAPLPGCTFAQAVRRLYGRYATFAGRSSRSEYWKIALPLSGIMLFCQLAASGGPERIAFGTKIIMAALLLIWVATFVPFLALSVRRLHDANFSGWYYLLVFVPLVGGLALMIIYALPSNPDGARFDRRVLVPRDEEGS